MTVEQFRPFKNPRRIFAAASPTLQPTVLTNFNYCKENRAFSFEQHFQPFFQVMYNDRQSLSADVRYLRPNKLNQRDIIIIMIIINKNSDMLLAL